MSEVSTLTIVFRGLMIFHKDEENDRMEIGILRVHGHIPRVLTIKNGVLAAVRVFEEEDLKQPFWELEVTNPVGLGVSTYTNGSVKFERKTHKDDRDFRWIMDLEARDFYNRDLTKEMNTNKLMPVLHVPHGEFYTRLKSPLLLRKEGPGEFEPFGCVAAVTGCDIPFDGGGAELKVAGGSTLFTFKNEPNTIYEITNTPPDVVPPPEQDGRHVGGPHTEATPATQRKTEGKDSPPDHFQHYYDLFPVIPSPRFEFQPANPTPGPDPALCGKGMLGKRTNPLRVDEVS